MFVILNETFWKPYAANMSQPFVIVVSVLAVCVFGVITYYLVEKPFAKLYNKIFGNNNKLFVGALKK